MFTPLTNYVCSVDLYLAHIALLFTCGLLIVYLYNSNIKIKKRYTPALTIVEMMLDLNKFSIVPYIKSMEKDLDFLSLACKIVYDRICLSKLLHRYKHQNYIREGELVNGRVTTLFNLANDKSEVVQLAILGMLSLQAKISAINSHPEDKNSYYSYTSAPVLYETPSDIEHLFNTLLILRGVAIDLEINLEVFEDYSIDKVLRVIQEEHFETPMYHF